MLDPIGEIRQERERAREAGDPLTDVCYLITVASTDRAEAAYSRCGTSRTRGSVC